MSTPELILYISIMVNVAALCLLLVMVYPKAIQLYKKKLKSRETQKNAKIKKVVREYLKELQK